MAVTVAGDGLTVDFTGTSDQRDNALNVPAASTLSMMNYAVKCILAPEIAQNQGCNRPVSSDRARGHGAQSPLSRRRFRAPSDPAGARRLRAEGHGAAGAGPCVRGLPGQFPAFCAGGFDDRPEKRNGSNSAQPYYVISDIVGGGMGGHESGDGMDVVDTHGGNCALCRPR